MTSTLSTRPMRPAPARPEIGGPNSFQAQQVIRQMAGINLVGADLVEVAPPVRSRRAARRGWASR